jgi:[ribosomal protein S5]-alanine N-acetyltransferase
MIGRTLMNINTDRLLIREFKHDDWREVYPYTSDCEVMRYIPEQEFTVKVAKEFVIKNQGKNAKYFPVILKAGNTLIGHLVFHPFFGEHTYEIGWVFNPKFYGRGYATEAAKAVVNHAFKEMKLHRIIATCQPENIPSYRVMEKIGMRREGYFKKCIPSGDEWWDEYYYAILREEWH